MLSVHRLLCQVVTRPQTLWSRRLFSSSLVMYMENEDDKALKKRLHPARRMSQMSLEDGDTPVRSNKSIILESEETVTKAKRLDPIDAVNTGTHIPKDWRKKNLPDWKRQKYALAEKFDGKGWDPKKKLSRESMQSVRILKAKLPDLTASQLSEHFEVSVEAIRRILKSKWAPKNDEESEKVMERWKKRKERVKLATKENSKSREMSEFKNIVVLNSGKEYTSVKATRSTKDFISERKQKKGSAKSRLSRTERNTIRKMEF